MAHYFNLFIKNTMSNKELCYDVIGKIIEYIELEDVLDYMVLNKQIYKNFCEGYYKIYDCVELEPNRGVVLEFSRNVVPYYKIINFITCGKMNIRWIKFSKTNKYCFCYDMPNITYINLGLYRGEFDHSSKKTLDFSKCHNLKCITIYNYMDKIYDCNIKYKDNKSIVELDLESSDRHYREYFLDGNRKICTLTFIGYNYAIKIEVCHDEEAHELFLNHQFNIRDKR